MLLEGARSMRGYGQADENLDEYEDDLEDEYGDLRADRYEDDEEEEEEYEEQHEEEESIPEEKLRYLDLRQKLKEAARSKIRKENGATPNKSQDRMGASSLGKFGSFFGPSRPTIADRVIQESKSLLETRHLAAKPSTSQNNGKKVTVAPTSEPKNGMSNKPLYNKAKTKAQMIKQNRDFYSSLLSDDAEIPKQGRDPAPQKNLVSRTDARSAQVPARSSDPSSSSSKKALNGYEQRKPSPGIPQRRPSQTVHPEKMTSSSRANLPSSDSKRQLDSRKQPQSSWQPGSSSGAGPVRSALPKVLPPKKPLSMTTSDKRAPVCSMERKASVPVGTKASVVAKSSTFNRQRPPPVKSQTSVISSRVENKRDIRHSSEGRLLKKESVPASKLQSNQTVKQPHLGRDQYMKKQDPRPNMGRDQYIKKQKPAGQLNAHKSGAASKDSYNKKRRADEAFSDEEVDVRSLIRGMFGRPRHYEDIDDEDDDDMCMEVGFDAIQREESRSARIARKEDEEELAKIIEEEKQERLRKQAKLRKTQR